MDAQSTFDSIRHEAIRVLPPDGVAILYGSHARGDWHAASDWDILIILNKDFLEPSDYDAISYPFVLLGCELGQEINPILYTRKEWDMYHGTPFSHNVERDGILLN